MDKHEDNRMEHLTEETSAERKTLGMIGGMGPEATSLLYRTIIDNTAASRDQDHLDIVILSHASMPDRTKAIENGEKEHILNLFLRDAKKLEAAGASVVVIPCNTAHYLLPDLIAQSSQDLTFINMIQETAAYTAHMLPAGSKVGVLATDGLRKMKLYENALLAEGLVPVFPSDEGQAAIMKIIYEQVKSGKKIDAALFHKVVYELRMQDCKKIILGCTELSVVNQVLKLDNNFVDPVNVVAERCIVLCGGKLKAKVTPLPFARSAVAE
jgi:aspartate racemase